MILKTTKSLEKEYKDLLEKIVEDSFNYDDSLESYKLLETEWNLLYKMKKVLDKRNKNKVHYMSYDGKQIYVCGYYPIKYKIDNELLNTLTEKKDEYTQEEIETLLKWTVNNTRNDLEIESGKNIHDLDVMGMCGLAQYCSIRPFEKLGLKVTYNNVTQLGASYRHAFGTVTFPTKFGEKTYLIDTTYAQFFKLERNVTNFEHKDAGYYMIQNDNTKAFAESLLNHGFVAATKDNILKYAYGFLQESGKTQTNLEGILQSESVDYTDDELEEIGLNVTLGEQNKKKL